METEIVVKERERLSLLPRTERGKRFIKDFGSLWTVNKDGTISPFHQKRKQVFKVDFHPDFLVQERIRRKNAFGVTVKGSPVVPTKQYPWSKG